MRSLCLAERRLMRYVTTDHTVTDSMARAVDVVWFDWQRQRGLRQEELGRAMTEIMQLIHRYRGGEMSLDELADLLAGREYREPSRYGPPPPGITAEEHALEQLGTFPEADT